MDFAGRKAHAGFVTCGVGGRDSLARQFERRRCGAGAELRIEAVEPSLHSHAVSAFSDLAAIAPQDIWDAVSVRAVQGERVALGVVELDPNAVVPEHRHENSSSGL